MLFHLIIRNESIGTLSGAFQEAHGRKRRVTDKDYKLQINSIRLFLDYSWDSLLRYTVTTLIRNAELSLRNDLY